MDVKLAPFNPDLELAIPQAASGRRDGSRILDSLLIRKLNIVCRNILSAVDHLTMGKETPRPKDRLPRRLRIIIVTILFVSWSFIFTLLSNERVPFVKPAGSAEWLPVRKLTCTDTFWNPDECGMDGVHCEPSYGRLVAFECPAHCVRDGVVRGPRPHLAGGHEVLGRPLVIGGPIYRGDSYVCPAAVHAGVADDEAGGCGVAKYMGMTNSFSASYMYDVESVDVQTYFPLTFRFTVESEDMACPARASAAAAEGEGEGEGDGGAGWMLPYVSAAHTALVWRTSSSPTARTLWALAVTYGHLSLRGSPWEWVRSWWASSSSSASTAEVDVPIPQVLEPEIFMDSISNFTIKWATPVPAGVEGISMLVDDVERARRFFGKGAKKNKLREGESADSFFWQRTPQAFVDYIRFGYIKNGKVLKYSKPGIWFTNGTWTGIPAEK